MALTSANITDFIRSLIGERTAKYWLDAEITSYVTLATAKAIGKFGPWLFETAKVCAAFAITAGTDEYTQPTNCSKVSYIQRASDGRHLRYITEDQYYKYAQLSDGEPEVWTFMNYKIKLLPKPETTAATDYYIWYMPYPTDIGVLPEPMKGFIAVDAVIMALTKNREVTPDLFDMRKEFEQATITDLSLTVHGQGMTMSEDAQNDYMVR